MRNPNPFTDRQLRLVKALRDALQELLGTGRDYEFRLKRTKQFGLIPTLKFDRNAQDIKTEVIQKAGLYDEERKKKLREIQERYGVRARVDHEARLFNSEFDNLMFALKKHLYAIALTTNQFAGLRPDDSDRFFSLLQESVLRDFAQDFPSNPSKKNIQSNSPNNSSKKSYLNELKEV